MQDKHEAEKKLMKEHVDELTTMFKNTQAEYQVCLTLMGFPMDKMQILYIKELFCFIPSSSETLPQN